MFFFLFLSEKPLQKPTSQVPSAQTKSNRHPQHQRAKHNRKRGYNLSLAKILSTPKMVRFSATT
jgi:hypothetical protein